MGGANLGGAKVGGCGFFFTELAITDDGCGGNGGRGPTLSPDRLLSNNEIVVKNSVQHNHNSYSSHLCSEGGKAGLTGFTTGLAGLVGLIDPVGLVL